jgi:hypothetical protein
VKVSHGNLLLSATDLSNHLACRHLTALDYAVARGEKSKPASFDPRLAILRERGLQHDLGEAPKYLGVTLKTSERLRGT